MTGKVDLPPGDEFMLCWAVAFRNQRWGRQGPGPSHSPFKKVESPCRQVESPFKKVELPFRSKMMLCKRLENRRLEDCQNLLGETPNASENTRLKYFGSVNPTAQATSLTVIPLSRSSSFALARRMERMKMVAFFPVSAVSLR